eukprot:gene32443-54922_t
MKSKILSFILVGILFSCGTNPNPKQSKYSTLKVDNLTDKDLFTFVKVKAYMDQNTSKSEEHNSLFLKGIEAFKNDKNLDSASYYFKESILKMPTNMAYYELGNVLMDEKNYDQAIVAYSMAERLGYEPFSKVLYNIACACSLQENAQLAGKYLEYAIQAGYSNIENIEKDKDL